jgi:hypothetical protein
MYGAHPSYYDDDSTGAVDEVWDDGPTFSGAVPSHVLLSDTSHCLYLNVLHVMAPDSSGSLLKAMGLSLVLEWRKYMTFRIVHGFGSPPMH